MSTEFPHLFSPLQVGPVRLPNRIVSPPHGTGFAQGGLPTERQLAYHEARARGGAGLIVVGSLHVYPPQWSSSGLNLAEDPRAVDGYRRLAESVHRHGSFLSGQLHFSGSQHGSLGHRRPLLAASPVPSPQFREIPKEIEGHEIEDLIDHFARSAANVKAGEWDGVEIFAAQGYGLSQFLSSATNHREDEWGGDLAGRARILLRIVERVHEAVGPEFLLGVRINLDDLVAGGLTIAESIEVVRMLEASGQVDYINASASASASRDWPLWIGDMSVARGTFLGLARELRPTTSLPLALATRIKDPAEAEEILAEGAVDLIGMNRALIADPDLPRKAREGRASAIRPCINSNQGCLVRFNVTGDISCTVNPLVGLEAELGDAAPAQASLQVAVVGGGPAGLQAALTAARRGHAVTLFEQGERLGGQVRLASRATARRELGEIVDWQERQLGELDVEIRLGETATSNSVAGHDAVVLATGSVPLRTGFTGFRPGVRSVPGHELPHVMTSWEAIEGAGAVGERVVVFEDDPHVQATTTAEILAEHGRQVTIVTRNHQVGLSIGQVNLEFLYQRLHAAGVSLVAGTWVEEIGPNTVRCANVYSGAPLTLTADAIVLCTGNRVHDELYRELVASRGPSALHRVGDCLAPRMLDQAIREGFLVGREL